MIKITFPDGSVREFAKGITGLQLAESISSRLAQEVLAITVNEQIWDLSRPIETDAAIKLHNGTMKKVSMLTGTRRLT